MKTYTERENVQHAAVRTCAALISNLVYAGVYFGPVSARFEHMRFERPEPEDGRCL